MSSVIRVWCSEIQSSIGFAYEILPVLLNHTLSADCEQSWYSEDLLIADPSDPLRLADPATAVESHRLFTSHCVDVSHQIICDSADGLHYSHKSMFRVRNDTEVTQISVIPSLQRSDQLWWLSILVIIVFLLVLIGFLLHKLKLGCSWKAAPFVCRREDDDPENRDPVSGVQMKLRSDESDSVTVSRG